MDECGNEAIRTYSMYVRDLDYDIDTDLDVYNMELENKRIKINGNYQEIEVILYELMQLCEIYEDDIRDHGISSGVTLTRI